MTHAIRTARGSAPIPCAIERQIGTISAVVAVLDMKFVSAQQRIKTVKVKRYGDGWLPSARITEWAMSSPAPVSASAAARERVPPKRKMVRKSIALRAFSSEITPVSIRTSAPIPAETQSFTPIFFQISSRAGSESVQPERQFVSRLIHVPQR